MAQQAKTHGLGHRPHRRPESRRDEQRHEELRWKDVERVTVGQHQSAHPAVVTAECELADRSAGVVADEHDVREVEYLEQIEDRMPESTRGQDGFVRHRGAMRAEWPVRHDAAYP